MNAHVHQTSSFEAARAEERKRRKEFDLLFPKDTKKTRKSGDQVVNNRRLVYQWAQKECHSPKDEKWLRPCVNGHENVVVGDSQLRVSVLIKNFLSVF